MKWSGRLVLVVGVLGAGLCLSCGCAGKPRLAPVPQSGVNSEDQAVRTFDFNGDGKCDYREILGADGAVRYHQFDPRGDGSFSDVLDRQTLDPDKTQHVFLLLDGLPYSLIEQMWQDGYFRIFGRPGRIVSSFPSLTDPAYDQILHCGIPYGYEAAFYDRATGRTTPGVSFYLSGKNEAWEAGIDYRLGTIEDAVMYIWPGGVFQSELVAARKVYDRMQAKDRVVLYLLSPDGMCHMFTREKAREHFALLDRWIEQMVYDARGRIQVTMLADHGNNFAGCRFVPIQETLKASGLRVVDRLKKSGDVVVPRFGLINFASVFCYSDVERRRAVDAILPLEGVDAVAWREGEVVCVANRHGSARINRIGGDGQDRFRYRPIEGDPLGVLPTVQQMQEKGQVDADGYATEEAWFLATRDLPMPAPVQRVYHSLHSNAVNIADVVISMADGYYYGDRSFEKFVKLNGTHGGLSREGTDSFLMSTAFEAPAYCRLDEVLPVINQAVAWRPHIPSVDYAWLDRYRRRVPLPAGHPTEIHSASATAPTASQSAPQAAIAR
jgi:hypothetical protein